MRVCSPQLAVACAMTLSIAAIGLRPSTDQQAVQGRWNVIDARARMGTGVATKLTGVVGHGTIRFAGNRITLRDVGNGQDSSSTYAFVLDTLTSPHRINLVGAAPAARGWSGIYQLGGDSLRLALPVEHWSDRPMSPVDCEAPNTMVLILTRDRR